MDALKATVAFHVQYNYRLNSFVFYIDPENSTDLDKIAKYAVKFDEIPPPYLKWLKIFMSKFKGRKGVHEIWTSVIKGQ